MFFLPSLCEKCPNTEFFLARIFLYSVRMQEITDQKKLCIQALFTQCLLWTLSINSGFFHGNFPLFINVKTYLCFLKLIYSLFDWSNQILNPNEKRFLQYCSLLQRTIHKIRNTGEKNSKNIYSKKPSSCRYFIWDIYMETHRWDLTLNQYMTLHISTALLGIVKQTFTFRHLPSITLCKRARGMYAKSSF